MGTAAPGRRARAGPSWGPISAVGLAPSGGPRDRSPYPSRHHPEARSDPDTPSAPEPSPALRGWKISSLSFQVRKAGLRKCETGNQLCPQLLKINQEKVLSVGRLPKAPPHQPGPVTQR